MKIAMNDVRGEYPDLLEKFLAGDLSAQQFQKLYLEKFKREQRRVGDELYDLLQEAFGDVDSFTTDADLIKQDPDFYLNEQRLREKIRLIASQLPRC